MSRILLACLLPAVLSAQSAQELSIARQQESIAKQRAALEAQDGAIAKQVASASQQPRLTPWAPMAVAPVAPIQDCSALTDQRLDRLIHKAANDNELTPDLLRAVIRKESSYQPCAVSRAGAMGLMQLMPGTAFDLGVDDPFDPEQNLNAGSRFLRTLLNRYGGDLSLALSAYNAGPGRVDAAGGIPPIKETQNYVKEILDRLR